MADKKLRIPRKLKTETLKQLKIRTDMNSDAPYESGNNFAPFLALNLRKNFFTLVWKHILSI